MQVVLGKVNEQEGHHRSQWIQTRKIKAHTYSGYRDGHMTVVAFLTVFQIKLIQEELNVTLGGLFINKCWTEGQ